MVPAIFEVPVFNPKVQVLVEESPLLRETWGFIIFDPWVLILDFRLFESRPSPRHKWRQDRDRQSWSRLSVNWCERTAPRPSIPESIQQKAREAFLAQVQEKFAIDLDGSARGAR